MSAQQETARPAIDAPPYARGFFDLQLRFAERIAALAGLPLSRALLEYTNLYVRFGLGRDFDPAHPGWRDYEAGLAVEHCEVTSRERRQPHFTVVTAFARKAT